MALNPYRIGILRRWSISVFCGIITFFTASIVFPVEPLPDWNISLKKGEYIPSTITVWNRCTELHDFEVEKKNLPYIHFVADAHVSVKGHSHKIFPIFFNTRGLESGIYTGELAVKCTSCIEEPGCARDKSILPVRLTISYFPAELRLPVNDMVSADYKEEKINACAELPVFCAELCGEAWSAEYRAEVLETNAEGARSMAEQTENAAEYFERLAAQKTLEARGPDSKGSGGSTPGSNLFWESANILLGLLVPDYARHASRNKKVPGSSLSSRNRPNLSSRPKEEEEAAQALDNAVEARIAGKIWGKAVTAAENAAKTARTAADEARRTFEACINW